MFVVRWITEDKNGVVTKNCSKLFQRRKDAEALGELIDTAPEYEDVVDWGIYISLDDYDRLEDMYKRLERKIKRATDLLTN